MYQIPFTIKVLTPVVFSEKSGDAILTATRDYFSGNTLRGLLALEYIKQNKLGKTAHLDGIFDKYFLKRGLCFAPAYIAKNGAGEKLQNALVLPLSMQKSKNNGTMKDLRTDKPTAGFKSWKGYALIDAADKTAAPISVNTTIELHMSRYLPQERVSGTSDAGNIYNYEAISTGQCFKGYISGEKELLNGFMEDVLRRLGFGNEPCRIAVGRSRHTQYGLCEISVAEIEAVPQPDKGITEHLWLYCYSPYIPEHYLSEQQYLVAEIQERLGLTDLSIGQSFAAAAPSEGFVGIWGIKKPRRTQINAGSIFEIRKNTPWTAAELQSLQKLCYQGLGDNTLEGYGQMRIWNAEIEKIAESSPKESVQGTYKYSQHSLPLIHSILSQRLLEAVKIKAYQDSKLTGGFKQSKSLIGRLEAYLDRAKGSKNRFEQYIRDEIRKDSPAEKTLRGIVHKQAQSAESANSQRNCKLLEILKGEKYEIFDISEQLDERTIALAKETKYDLRQTDKIYMEYWRWFLRYSRKNAKGGADSE